MMFKSCENLDPMISKGQNPSIVIDSCHDLISILERNVL